MPRERFKEALRRDLVTRFGDGLRREVDLLFEKFFTKGGTLPELLARIEEEKRAYRPPPPADDSLCADDLGALLGENLFTARDLVDRDLLYRLWELAADTWGGPDGEGVGALKMEITRAFFLLKQRLADALKRRRAPVLWS
jgi:hypothetical protein